MGGDYVPRLILTSLIVSLMTEGSKDDGFKMDETHRGKQDESRSAAVW